MTLLGYVCGLIYFTLVRLRTCDSTVIKLGVILPESPRYPWSLKRVMPAIDYAIENLPKKNLLPGSTVIPETRDSECSETMGPLSAVDFHMNKNVHVFFGPVCDYAIAPVARFSPHWNIPVLSAGALVTDFDNKNEYKLLTRVHGAYSNGADFFLHMAEKFNWTNLGLIYHDHKGKGKGKSDCYFRMEALFFKLKNEFNKEPWNKNFDEKFPAHNDFGEILRLASLNVRSKYIFSRGVHLAAPC